MQLHLFPIYQLLWLFFIYAFLGWCTEVAYAALDTGKLVNRGFLNGPLCPIYGCGMAAVLTLLLPLQDNLLILFAGGMLLTTLIELVGGWALKTLFHTTWWDYSDKSFNLGGYICLEFSILWGIGATIMVRVVHPVVMKLNFPFITRKPSFNGRTLIEGRNTEMLHEYVLAMALELRANAADFADCEVQAIRLGGGSASITNGSDIDHLLRLIRNCYHVAENAPVTMRTCPADINGANMPFYNRSHITRYDLELYSLEPLDFCTLDTLNYTQQMPYITHGFLRADSRNSMGFILLYGKKNVSRYGFRHSVLEATRRPVCHVILQRCAGRDMLDDAAAEAQLAEADELLTAVGFVQYLPRRWAKPGCEDKFWQGAAAGMDVLAFGLCACTKLDGMETTNTGDLSVYLAHSADYEQITVSTVPAEKTE